MSQLPVKGTKQAIAPNKSLSPQKLPNQPLQSPPPQHLQKRVQNQVGFYSEQSNIPASRNVSQSSVAEYKDLNDKKTGFAIHSLYALLVILVGTAAYLYAMKVKPPKVEVVEKVVEKTIERVEYVSPPPVETRSYSKIEIEVNVPLVEKKPERNRFEEDFKVEEVRRKYQKMRSEYYKINENERTAYLNSNIKHGSMDWGYQQIYNKYTDYYAELRGKEYNEICEVTDSAFWCDQAKKYSAAFQAKQRSPASSSYSTIIQNSSSSGVNEDSQPIYPNNPTSPANNGIDSVGKDVEEI